MTGASSPDIAELFGLRDRVAVVTGASSGLGMRFATVLASAGATVYAAARRTERLEQLATGCPGIVPVTCDVTSASDRDALAERVAGGTGRVDVLVNNAGIGGETRVEDESADVVRAVLELNLVAALELCRLFAARVPERSADGGGSGLSIVNVASVLALVAGHPLGGAAYAASKGAMLALTRELAAQWGRRGIRVNALAPGWFRSEMTQEMFDDERASRYVTRNTLLNRPGELHELDGAMLFLASSSSTYVTGQVVVVDGGWTAR